MVKLTHAQLSEHSSDEFTFVAIQSKIYQIPDSFLDLHPGGRDILELMAGKDCTKEVEMLYF